jgi:4-amino-4-deoxy-L-arabinose transferase-like glycosyltransferase
VPASVPVPAARVRFVILGIVLLAAVLRVWTIGNGIPYTTGSDEPVILEKALNILKSGDLNPHFFDYGGLTIYLHAATATVRFAAGAMGGEWTSLDKVWEGDFYLWSRLVTALLGTLTVYIVYRVGLRWGVDVALIAALMAAVHPNLVRESHYALADTPLTFFVALTLLVSLVAGEDGRLRWFLVAGVVAGLATATKYNGALALLMPLTAATVAPTTRLRLAAAATAAGGLLAGFVLTAPYSLLDLPHFLNGFASLAQHYAQPRPASEIATDYLKHFRGAFGLGRVGWWLLVAWPGLLFCAIGLARVIAQLFSPARRVAAAILLVYGLSYFWMISHQSLVYARYALPIMPTICLMLGLGITPIRDWLTRQASGSGWRRQLLTLTPLLVLIPPTVLSVNFDLGRRLVGTDELMARWLLTNLDPKTPIAIEGPTIRLPPGFTVDHPNKITHESLDSYRSRGVKYLVAPADMAYGEAGTTAASPSGDVAAYRKIFASTEVVKIIQSTPEHPGTTLAVLRIPNS